MADQCLFCRIASGEIPAKIVRRLSPQIGALLFEFSYLVERPLEILDLTDGFLLLKLEVLSDALLDTRTA